MAQIAVLPLGLLATIATGFAVGALRAVLLNRHCGFGLVGAQAAAAGVASAVVIWNSPCSDCLVPADVGGVMVGAVESLITLSGVGLGWAFYNASRLAGPLGGD